jgi:autotransporter-associated beta strand protein
VVPAFISDLDSAEIQSGGLLIDSAGFDLVIPQNFSGSGDIVKSGTGNLALTGESSHTGNVLVTGGTISLSNFRTGGTDFTLSNNTGLSVYTEDDFSRREMGVLTFGSNGPTTLNIDLGNYAGNTEEAPIDAAAIAVNGVVTVNIADLNIGLGEIPLIRYGSKTGSGSFVMGTLPTGVTADIIDNGDDLIYLDVSVLSQPKWDATASDVWDLSTFNWLNGGSPSKYTNGSTTQFDDTVTGPTQGAVKLESTVTPTALTFENSTVSYSISGGGNISGTTGLVKKGDGPLTLATVNGYTGVTDLQGGTTTIGTIANAGSPSAIGAASANAANLLFSGGSLTYTGAAVSTDRGFTVAGVDSTLTTAADLTITGEIASTGSGNLTKAGAGNLILSGTTAKNIGTFEQALRIHGGGVTFNGTGTNTVGGEIWVGGETATGNTSLTVSNTTLTTANWIAIGPGNGTTNLQATVTFTNSTVTANGGGISLGYADELPNYLTTSTLTLNNSTFTGNTGNFAESGGATAAINVNGTSVLNLGQLNLGMGNGSSATMTLKDSTATTVSNRLYIAQDGGSSGILEVKDNATVTVTGDHEFRVATSGQGTLTQSGGTISGSGWMSIGRGTGGVGVLNVTGGTFTQAGTDRFMHVGELGSGTLNISQTGAFVALSTTGLLIADTPESSGVINLDGGSLTATAVLDAANGASTFNFNGGQLIAGTGANAVFMNAIDIVTVKVGGAKIDSNGNNITINPALLAAPGNGGLTKTGAGILTLAGINTYTGNTAVNAGGLTLADNAQLKFVIGANGVNSAITGSGAVQLDGDFNIDTTTASATSGNTWTLVNVGTLTETYGASFSVIGFTNNSGVWTKTEGANTWTFTQSTGVLSVTGGGGGGYSTWAAANAGGQAANLDFDKDGVSNGVEYFMGATGSSFTANPGLVSGKVTWPKDPAFSGTYSVQTSPNLVTWTNVSSTVVGNTVEYTPATGQGKLFVRLLVNPN